MAYRIKDYVIMDMPFVNMGSNHILVLSLQHFIRKLDTDLMSFLRRDFPRKKGLNEVVGEGSSIRIGFFSSAGELLRGHFRRTRKSGDKFSFIGFATVDYIIYCEIQCRVDSMYFSDCNISLCASLILASSSWVILPVALTFFAI